MKAKISITVFLSLCIFLTLCSCSKNNVWMLEFGKSREKVIKQMKVSGFKIQEDGYVGYKFFKPNTNISFAGNKWREINCYFSKSGLCAVDFYPDQVPITTEGVKSIANYLKSEGYDVAVNYCSKNPYGTWIKGDIEVTLENGIYYREDHSESYGCKLGFSNRKIGLNK